MPNDLVFAYDDLPVKVNPSIIIYKEFSSPNDEVVWTPQTGKRIYLTGIEISTTLPVVATTVQLQRAGNAAFLVVRFNTASATPYAQSFFSPLQFNINEAITVTSSLGTVDVTLFGYEM